MGSSTGVIFWCSVLCCLVQAVCAAGTAKKFTSTDIFSDEHIYKAGPYKVLNLTGVTSNLKCCPLMVAMPEDKGVYPVVQFQHGTSLRNTEYSTLISRIASWGFVVVAPQMYNPDNPGALPWNANPEIQDAGAILRWMQTGLLSALHAQGALATPDFTKVALAGHSRGGMVVLALAIRDTSSERQYSAVVGLDPVDGQWPFLKPWLLRNTKPDSLNVGVPTLILGTGLGQAAPACAPKERGHEYWYRDVMSPSVHFVVPQYGHMDFMNDNCRFGRIFQSISIGCKLAPCRGKPTARQPMREFAGGIVVAFLQKVLMHNGSAFDTAYNRTDLAPVLLDPPESKGKISAEPNMPYEFNTYNTTTESHQYASV